MNETMPTADKDATSRPPFPGTTNCHSAARPLHHDEKDRDQAAREQAAPEQDGPGIERQQAREERRRAPGNCGGDDEGNAETAFRTRLPHADASS
ncbi:hypothetical protein QIH85_25450 [Bradyrhizobium japonicum]|uniref:hypothetical protein n=1 Tax=Bradyrhizobium japonicum TaxID=375 RepID=UPI0027152B89|nr:hypothetical protein [Bradyrhizobium japonicum]WLB25215.1 hypothetical protein QIH85_25450 [Bradyrhizobium japonicum]